MQSDAMASSFFGRMIQQNRMDGAQTGKKNSSVAGSGSDNSSSGFDFRAVYEQVALMNSQASTITDANTLIKESTSSVENDRIYDPSASSAGGLYAPEDPYSIESRNEEKRRSNRASEDRDHRASALQASKVISDALTSVSDKLNLNIDPELKNLSISSVSKENAQQLSEIMYALKNIAGLLDQAVSKNVNLNLGAQSLDPAQSRELGAFVQSQLFKVEMGVGMLGAGEQVRDVLAQKMALPVAGNIPQALDPSQLTMSQAHQQKVFGDMFTDPSVNMTTLVQKIRDLCAEYGQQNGTANLNLVSAGTAQESGPDFMFDGAIMRALLKIDGKGSMASENIAAAQNQKINLLPGAVNLLNKESAQKGAAELISIVDGSAKGGFGSQVVSGLEGKTQGATYRTIDESVMRQLADKLQTAFKTGANEIRIQLRPDSLGEVKIRIRVDGDVVTAKIQVESQQVKHIVESNMQVLKDSLSQQHLQAGSLDVNVGNEGFSSQGDREVYQPDENGQRSSSEVPADGTGQDSASSVAIGDETGRRFGDNTVEYFA